MNRSEKLIIFQTLMLIGFTSWAFGGMTSWARPWIIGICSTAAIPLYFHCKDQWILRYGPLSDIAKKIPWPWLLFLLLGVISIFNPAYTPIPQEQGGGYAPLHFITWLPSTVTTGGAVAKLQLLAAFFFQATVLYHVVTTRKAIRCLMLLLYGNSLVLAIFGTIQKLRNTPEIYGSVPSPNPTFFGSFIYHNHWSAFILLSIGLGAGLYFHYQKRYAESPRGSSPGPLFLVSLLLLAITIPLSTSRSGTFLLIVFIIVFAGKALQLFLAKQDRLSASTRKLGLIGGAVGLILIGGTLYNLLAPALEFQVQRTEKKVSRFLEDGIMEERYYSSRDTWKMAMSSPAWGWGAGNFSTVFPLFQGEEIRGTPRRPSFYEHAHNDWFEYLSEFGFIGLAILLSVPAWILGRLLWLRRMTTLGAWSLLGCGLLGIYAFVDFPFANPAVFLLFATTFTLATKDYKKEV